jgi:hypothetical protein
MTTKHPCAISQASPDSLEKFAYCVASLVPAREPNDNNRLGYCLWGWLSERRGTLFQAIRAAGVRSTLTDQEILKIISARLEENGIRIQ